MSLQSSRKKKTPPTTASFPRSCRVFPTWVSAAVARIWLRETSWLWRFGISGLSRSLWRRMPFTIICAASSVLCTKTIPYSTSLSVCGATPTGILLKLVICWHFYNVSPVWVWDCRIDPLHYLAGWCKRCLNQVLVSFGFMIDWKVSLQYDLVCGTNIQPTDQPAFYSVSQKISLLVSFSCFLRNGWEFLHIRAVKIRC